MIIIKQAEEKWINDRLVFDVKIINKFCDSGYLVKR